MTPKGKMILRLLTVCCLLTACVTYNKTSSQTGKDPKTDINTEKSTSFANDYDVLDKIEVPFTLTQDLWDRLYKEYVATHPIRTHGNTVLQPYARLTEGSDFKAFIFVSIEEPTSPLLITMDKSGNILDGASLLTDWKRIYAKVSGTELAIINKDLTINLIDSLWIYETGYDGQPIEGSQKLTLTNELFRIAESGKIEKIR